MSMANPRSSCASSGSRTGQSKRRMLATGSQVDETSLYGSPKLATPSVDLCQTNTNETIQIITKDLIRNLRIPRKEIPPACVVLPASSFKRISSQSTLNADREAMKQAYKKDKEEKTKAAENRKIKIKEADLSRVKNQPLADLELEAHNRAQRLLGRAKALRMEQEDEIKTLNRLILNAQCQATRDAQIQERREIEEELAEEEKRLDTMMEVDRHKALEMTDRIDEQLREQRVRGKQQILDQIQERLESKQLLDGIKDQEQQAMKEALERRNLEDLQALEDKKMKQQLLQEEIMRINAEVMKAKEMKLEQERLADMKDAEFQQKKMERQAEFEAEQARIKKEKEMEIASLRAKQQKVKDHKAEQDDVRARRSQAIAERKWRMNERALAAKKAHDEAMLREARLEQVYDKQHCLATETSREKAMTERVLKVQLEAIAKEREEKEKKLQIAFRNADFVRQQIKERELSAIAQRREFFHEADRLAESNRQRHLRLQEIKEKKLLELKATGIGEKYYSEVERKAQKTF